jgi:adenylosuccinate lyase
VGEVIEGFAKGQKGSSAMPHKRNPISGENITGLSRLLRAYAQAGMENVVLWHERDMSHSSVERVAFPDAFQIADYALVRMTGVIAGLGIQKARIKENLDRAGSSVFSGHVLLALVRAGANREEAYYWVQECALEAFEKKKDFVDLACRHAKILKFLKAAEIRKIGSIPHQLRHAKKILRLAGT